MFVSEVILEFTAYVLIVFASMILHELSHFLVAKALREKSVIKVFYKKYLFWGLKLELERYSGVQSFIELRRRDKIRYFIIALAPYWLLFFGLWLIYSSPSIACVYAGYVIVVFHIVNLPLEFINL